MDTQYITVAFLIIFWQNLEIITIISDDAPKQKDQNLVVMTLIQDALRVVCLPLLWNLRHALS
jgi:hypothetical protein